MPPVKSTQSENVGVNLGMPIAAKKILSRRPLGQLRNTNIVDQNAEQPILPGKRKADHSPQRGLDGKVKRSALGNLTNNVQKMTLQIEEEAKKRPVAMYTKTNVPSKTAAKEDLIYDENEVIPESPGVRANGKRLTRATSKLLANTTTDFQRPNKRKEPAKKAAQHPPQAPVAQLAVPVVTQKKRLSSTARRISNDFDKTEEESLYVSALESVTGESLRYSENFEAIRRRSAQMLEQLEKVKTEGAKPHGALRYVEPPLPTFSVPAKVQDFDKLNWDDPFQVSHYAMEIFEYMRSRERDFIIDDYLTRHAHVTKRMRTIVVDWMAGIQETFEVNHETLYLAVKLFDLYLCRTTSEVRKDKLQLLAASAFSIASKYDERLPPQIDDFVYVTDHMYPREEIIAMEFKLLREVDFDLSVPLSYRFLRRYARCANVPLTTLTLARYILELSLMDYSSVGFSDSKKACAVLFMALRMIQLRSNKTPVWTRTLTYYSGYGLCEFAEYVPVLNAWLHLRVSSTVSNIYKKYSHPIFHQVANIALLTTEELFENDMDLDVSNASQSANQPNFV